MHGRHTGIKPHHWAATILAVVVALSIALVLAWFDRTSTDEPTTSSPAAGHVSAADDSDQLHACQGVWQAQARALDAAGGSLEQWQIHVDAMNRLMAGEITLAQAMDFWNQTRRGAAARVARSETAVGAYADVAPRCPGISDGSRPAGTSRTLWQCVTGLRARDRAIDAGTLAITTWKHHIMDMEMLRAGQITPQQATRMWLQNWRRGVRQLDAFTRLRTDAADAASC